MSDKKNLGGRKSTYDEKIVEELLNDIAENPTPNDKICASKEYYPAVQTMYKWRHQNRNGFGEAYARAKKVQVEAIIDNLISETYDSSNDFKEVAPGKWQANNVYSSRLRVRAGLLQWYASRRDPDNFGDKKIEDKVDDVRRDLDEMKIKAAVQQKRDEL